MSRNYIFFSKEKDFPFAMAASFVREDNPPLEGVTLSGKQELIGKIAPFLSPLKTKPMMMARCDKMRVLPVFRAGGQRSPSEERPRLRTRFRLDRHNRRIRFFQKKTKKKRLMAFWLGGLMVLLPSASSKKAHWWRWPPRPPTPRSPQCSSAFAREWAIEKGVTPL